MNEEIEKMEIKEISYASNDYQQELILRDEVLRKPLNMSLFEENLENEIYDIHLGAFLNNQLVGVIIITKLDSETIKFRQMAVLEPLRNLKIGSKLIKHAEKLAKASNYKIIQLNARKVAIGFYEKLGYNTIGEEFFEVGIPHKKMKKEISNGQNIKSYN